MLNVQRVRLGQRRRAGGPGRGTGRRL